MFGREHGNLDFQFFFIFRNETQLTSYTLSNYVCLLSSPDIPRPVFTIPTQTLRKINTLGFFQVERLGPNLEVSSQPVSLQGGYLRHLDLPYGSSYPLLSSSFFTGSSLTVPTHRSVPVSLRRVSVLFRTDPPTIPSTAFGDVVYFPFVGGHLCT